ncbi:MAG TPA: peptidase M50 [Firmicutes bacterium]|jgi:stage IV sporulation protein FB|nr:MAG: hypothetical protein AA931_00820 [Peptococcaceae bacterium 1109]HHT73479.1 peptidase M50 [Bacillota bacterium]
MRVGTYLGIPVKVNPLFFVLLLGAALFGLLPQSLILFAVVLWHETAHILVARLYHLDVTEVELLPFGGVARFEALLQTNPALEWKTAVIGPLSNVVLIGLLYAVQQYYALPPEHYEFAVLASGGLCLFNLLPALPLDGGRVLRSILVRRRGFREATDLAARIGQVIGVLMCCWGAYTLYLGYMGGGAFIVLGVFVFTAAASERKNAAYILMRYLTQKKTAIRLQRVLPVHQLLATVETSVGEVVQKFRPPAYHIVWIMNLEGELLGMVGELDIINVLFAEGAHAKVGTLMRNEI